MSKFYLTLCLPSQVIYHIFIIHSGELALLPLVCWFVYLCFRKYKNIVSLLLYNSPYFSLCHFNLVLLILGYLFIDTKNIWWLVFYCFEIGLRKFLCHLFCVIIEKFSYFFAICLLVKCYVIEDSSDSICRFSVWYNCLHQGSLLLVASFFESTVFSIQHKPIYS